jgi:hypothetical protein
MRWSDLRGDTESQAETSWPLRRPTQAVTAMNGPKVDFSRSLRETELYAGNSSKTVRYSPALRAGSQNPADRGTIRREGPSAMGTLRDFTLGCRR